MRQFDNCECKCNCSEKGLLHREILQEEYDDLDQDFKNCGVVYFIKEEEDSTTGKIVRNGVRFTGDGSGGADVDWSDIEEFITHNIGQQITELEENISSKMDLMKQNIINEIKQSIVDEVKQNIVNEIKETIINEVKQEITEGLNTTIQNQVNTCVETKIEGLDDKYVKSEEVRIIKFLTEEEYEQLETKEQDDMYAIPVEEE